MTNQEINQLLREATELEKESDLLFKEVEALRIAPSPDPKIDAFGFILFEAKRFVAGEKAAKRLEELRGEMARIRGIFCEWVRSTQSRS